MHPQALRDASVGPGRTSHEFKNKKKKESCRSVCCGAPWMSVQIPETKGDLGFYPPEPAAALLENVLILSVRCRIRFPSYVAACASWRSQSAVEMKEKMYSGPCTGSGSHLHTQLFLARGGED